MTAPATVPADLADRYPTRAPGCWCWRCGWWQADLPGRYRPAECPGCGPWSRERRLPLDTLRPVLVTVEAAR